MQTFLGLDLAWHGSTHGSALAVLRGSADRVELVHVHDCLVDDGDILDAITESSTAATVLALDAPLVIRNHSGQRQCETTIGQRFGHADASAHTTNLSRFPDARSVRLIKRLVDSGWAHDVDPAADRRRGGRWLFEVYPHPAHVVLFDLPKIIKYKKGRVQQRRAGLEELRAVIAGDLGAARPSLAHTEALQKLTELPLGPLRRAALKAYEDGLDSLLCAFIAAHYWAWGAERNEMVGTMAGGYIINPTRTARGKPWRFRRPAPSNLALHPAAALLPLSGRE